MNIAAPELPVDPLNVLRKRRSAKWQTYPADVLPLTVAEMDFALAAPVAEALREAVGRSDTGYAMATPGLGRALAGFAASRWDWEIDPASVTAVTDVGVGVVELLRLLARPGDAVVISPPVYPPFFDWVAEAGARLVEVPLAHGDAGWRLDLAALETAFAGRPAAYVLCNPHNPVGRVHTGGELAALVRLAQAHRVTIISDEIHGPLVLPGATFTPLLTVPARRAAAPAPPHGHLGPARGDLPGLARLHGPWPRRPGPRPVSRARQGRARTRPAVRRRRPRLCAPQLRHQQ